MKDFIQEVYYGGNDFLSEDDVPIILTDVVSSDPGIVTGVESTGKATRQRTRKQLSRGTMTISTDHDTYDMQGAAVR